MGIRKRDERRRNLKLEEKNGLNYLKISRTAGKDGGKKTKKRDGFEQLKKIKWWLFNARERITNLRYLC